MILGLVMTSGIGERHSNASPADVRSQLAEPEMVFVEGGTFTMGNTPEQPTDYYGDDKPAHSVTVSSFSIGKCEITLAEWKAIMGNNPSKFQGDDLPVERVTWEEAQEFISRLNKATGKKYRLPTEAEWEYAARGGKKSRYYKYSGSNNIDEVAWYIGNSGNRTHPVGTKKANELGIYDMTGNVWEWCNDWFEYYGSSAQTNPIGSSSGPHRVLRGGSWISKATSCHVSFRSYISPDARDSYRGFRIACSLE
jgi:formylglycine-generating enzyme required for sulfatase activity